VSSNVNLEGSAVFVRFALLGDAAVNTGGKWNLLGNFNLVRAKQFPATWPRMGLLLRIEGDHREIGEHVLQLDFVDDTGVRLAGPGPMPFEFKKPRLPGFPVEFVIGLEIHGLTIPAPGNYDFTIRVDGTYLDSLPLYVRDAKNRRTQTEID
jgi:hypothetical protein